MYFRLRHRKNRCFTYLVESFLRFNQAIGRLLVSKDKSDESAEEGG